MNRSLFVHIVVCIYGKSIWSVLHPKTKRWNDWFGFPSKITVAMWMLAYEVPADSMGDYLRIVKSTNWEFKKARQCGTFNLFRRIFKVTNLRSPNDADMARLVPIGEASVKFSKHESRICEKLIPEGRLMSEQRKKNKKVNVICPQQQTTAYEVMNKRKQLLT